MKFLRIASPVCRSLLISLIAALALPAQPVLSQESAPTLPVVTLTAGMYLVHAELADNERNRQTGLMFRQNLGANQGMVFLFDALAPYCMWMRNTLIPLSVAFLDDAGRIINIADMQPHSDENHCAAKPARYALEMNQGWFAKRGLGPGMRITGLPKPQSP